VPALAHIPQGQRGRCQAEEKERAGGMSVRPARLCAKYGARVVSLCAWRALDMLLGQLDVD